MLVAQPEINVAETTPQVPTRARYGTLGFLCALTLVLYLDRMCIADWAVATIRDRRYARSLVGCGAFVIAAFAMASGAAMNSPEGKSICFMLVFFGVHLHLATWWSVNSEIAGQHTAAVFGFVNSSGVLGVATIQIVFGYLPRERWNHTFYAMSLVLLLGAICWSMVNAKVPIEPSQAIADL